jgi:hypothetical protein
MVKVMELTDQQINEYINQAFSEELIRRTEDHLLSILKFRQEKYPTEKNDKEWLDYTNFISRRRCQ